jgi:hypothetical protein
MPHMKKSIFLLSVWGLLRLLPAADKPFNFSGTWVPDVLRSDAPAKNGNAYGPLVIVQTEKEIQLHRTVSGRRVDERFQLDGKKIVTRMPDGNRATIKPKLKRNMFEVTIEFKHAGEQRKLSTQYSLSEDGKTLNVSNMSTVTNVSTTSNVGMRLVYNKSDAALATAFQPSNPGLPEKAVKPEADAAPGTASQPINPSPPEQVVNPESYAAAALESVKNQRSVDGLNLEMIGEPVLKPDGSGLNTNAPDAIVLVNLNKGTNVREQAMVIFANNRPARTLFSPQKSPFSEGTLDRAELQQVANELDAFFTAAVDVSRGSERFYPYFPKDIRSLLKHPDRKFRMYMPPGAVDPSWREQLAGKGAMVRGVRGLEGSARCT